MRAIHFSLVLLLAPAMAAAATPAFSITNIAPPSNLLAPGTDHLTLSFTTSAATTCGWSLSPSTPFVSMTAFEQQPATSHQGPVSGLATDTRVVNTVFIRCAANPDYSQSVQYRDVPARNGIFPRIGSIWGGGYVYYTQPEEAEKMQLFLGPYIDVAGTNTLRNAEPTVIVLPSYNATAQSDPSQVIPDDYYLKDVNGHKIQNWPTAGAYLLNLTKPEVANYLAQLGYQYLTDNNLAFDGIFWDNVFYSISWYTADVFGNPIQIDANNDGLPDDPATLDAAWRAGVELEVQTFRQLSPNAYMSGHLGQIPADPGELTIFNGDSLVFETVNVQEGLMPFGPVWETYNEWFSAGRQPAITMVQASPPNQLSYGYGFDPQNTMLPATLSFAQSWYPNVRFGLAMALMNDGFFTFDLGDAGGAVAWWYDEFDFPIGVPTGPNTQLSSGRGPNLVSNGGFEQGMHGWYVYVAGDGQASAASAIDSVIAAEGDHSAMIAITSPDTYEWNINLSQGPVALTSGITYQLRFWARASAPAGIWADMQGGPPDYPNYGLYTLVNLTTTWQLYTLTFIAPVTSNDGAVQFNIGRAAATVWIDGVELSTVAPDVYRRDYTQGTVLLNATNAPQTIAPGSGFRRFTGTQAPRYQYIVDDSSAAFTFTGAWQAVTYNSGGGTAGGETVDGPFFHAWGMTCHELDSGAGSAQWNLGITQDGNYTLEAWLPAATSAGNWTKNAIYEVLGNGAVIFSATLDQSTATAGDQWHVIAGGLHLTAAASPTLRVRNNGSGPLIADALYVHSAALYNDGSAASSVTLAPMDGILLQRTTPIAAPSSRVTQVTDAAGYGPAIAPGTWVSIFGAGFNTTARTWGVDDFVNGQLPTSLAGVSATIDGQPTYISYAGPGQINALMPADANLGQVSVQVATPRGPAYSGSVMLQRLAPQLFTWAIDGVTYAAAEHTDYTPLGSSPARPAAVGEVVVLYGTGFGPTSPQVPVSQAYFTPAQLTGPATVTIGGAPAKVQWAGLIGPGLYQLNVEVPKISPGDQPVIVSAAGFEGARGVYITVGVN